MGLIIMPAVATLVFYLGWLILEWREQWINKALQDEAVRLAVSARANDPNLIREEW